MKLYSILAIAGIVGLFSFYLVGKAARPDRANVDGYALENLRRLPVQEGGRIKPLDTHVRTALRIVYAKEEFEDPITEKKLPAIRWFIEVAAADTLNLDKAPPTLARTGIFWSAETFRIDNDQVVQMLGLKPRSGLSYSLKEIYNNLDKLGSEADKAADVVPADRDKYQHKVLEFQKHFGEFHRINSHDVAILPPLEPGGKWDSPYRIRQNLRRKITEEICGPLGLDPRLIPQMPRDLRRKLMAAIEEQFIPAEKELIASDPRMKAWDDMLRAYRDRSPERFERAVDTLAAFSKTVPEDTIKKSRFEVFFNHFEPFVDSMAMYIVVVILAGGAMLTSVLSPSISAPFRWSALGMMALAFGVHGFGLITRMYLQDRWLVFVTNLYSSAIFIGWAAALMSLVMELVFPRGIALTVGGVIGLSTSIIAHNLGSDRDTLEMMQAVLDTNFWLATHVTIVSLGYMATFLAGLLGLTFVGLGVFTKMVDHELWKTLSQMIYGVLSAATLMSFTGTVLGGIWGDQSWGRFWGWDPKENGAVLIVLWNVIILHARWGGMIKQRGMAVMAIFGNIVTTWSWFGTNELGIGLHSYGFTEGTRLALVVFGAFNLVCMGIGLLPTRVWLSVNAWNREAADVLPGNGPPRRPKPKLA